MPAKSEKQKKFFGAAMGAKKGQSNVSGEAKKVAKELPKKEIKKFLKTEEDEESNNDERTERIKQAESMGYKRLPQHNAVWTHKGMKIYGVNNLPPLKKEKKGEEDEQSISKQMRKTGNATIKGPQVKERKRFAPATKTESQTKGKGSYSRKYSKDEDEQMTVPLRREPTRHEKIGSDLRKKNHTKPSIDHSKLGSVPLKRDDPPRSRIQQMDDDMKKRKAMKENVNIAKFIDCILTKNYASANKYIKQAVESKLQHKIERELSTPLF